MMEDQKRDMPRQALLLVEPETVVRWQRAGFTVYWVWILGKRTIAGKMREQGIARPDLPHGCGDPQSSEAAIWQPAALASTAIWRREGDSNPRYSF